MDDEKQPVPADQLPIEWVDPLVCADEFENRRVLRANGMRWRVVPPSDEAGLPTGLIEVVDSAVDARRQHERHRDILSDPRDPWSDFVDVREMPMDAAGVPYWIHRRAEAWEEWDARERLPGSKRSREPFLPVRCRAVKSDRTRCWAWAADKGSEGRCRAHAPGHALASNMGHNIAIAKVKIMQAMPAMVDQLEDLALNADVPQVRLKAITEMMDRGGVNAQTDINVSGGIEVSQDPAAEIRSRLDSLAARMTAKQLEPAGEPAEGEVLDAEIVPDLEEPA